MYSPPTYQAAPKDALAGMVPTATAGSSGNGKAATTQLCADLSTSEPTPEPEPSPAALVCSAAAAEVIAGAPAMTAIAGAPATTLPAPSQSPSSSPSSSSSSSSPPSSSTSSTSSTPSSSQQQPLAQQVAAVSNQGADSRLGDGAGPAERLQPAAASPAPRQLCRHFQVRWNAGCCTRLVCACVRCCVLHDE
jgi:hypothetical protein